jgi:hypothetical protein
VHCKSLALKGKEIGHGVQLGNLENDQMNWQFKGVEVGPTIQLGPLLVSISYYLHNFLNEMGAQNRKSVKGLISLVFFRRRSREDLSCDQSAMMAIQTINFAHKKHN